MKICAIQMNSTLEPAKNLETINRLIEKAKSQEPDLKAVFLPEVFYSISDGKNPTPYVVEDQNEHYQAIQKLAMEHQIYLLGGSAATKVDGKVFNRSYNFSPTGELISYYDKVHLFTIDLKESSSKTVLDERNLYAPGKELKSFDLEGFHLGLGICFDLRFPELFRNLFSKGANVLSISSAFTIPTGKAHWKTLLRARAIENQSYVVACNQWGVHNQDLNSYGHSMIIDPWGEIIAECTEGEEILFADLSLEHIKKIRARMDMRVRI